MFEHLSPADRPVAPRKKTARLVTLYSIQNAKPQTAFETSDGTIYAVAGQYGKATNFVRINKVNNARQERRRRKAERRATKGAPR